MESVINKRKIIRQKYIDEITKQGILDGERKMLRQLLEIKFGQLTADHIKQIDKANAERLKNMANIFLNTLTLDTIFKRD